MRDIEQAAFDDALQVHLRNEIRLLKDLLAEREAEIEALLELLDSTDERGLRGRRSASRWKDTDVMHQLRERLLSRYHRITHQSKYTAVERSPLFDAQWYAHAYPECGGPKYACAHYLRYGAFEGHDPGPDFKTESYYAANPDVRQAGWPALAHYLLHGQREERRLDPSDGESTG
ncbi:hypothetical protein HAT86_11865 [Roseovarius gahaiensis]|uniref:Uncharacterized protein n=1 Tax=Roseovarius gahaiensis TaxID=2716691 RepID=A0A967EJR5_9RHOB|nr:hypothetical protein [Roseovarius gahaiensis]NHQ75152.1 hypothetical protein [Roseovarius gahaiensis]